MRLAPRPRRARADHRQRGLTLVELLVSITLGLLIVGGVLYVYLNSKGAYRTSKSTSRVQEAGRFGLDAILRDVRQAGYIGCGSRMSLADFQPPAVYQLANPPLSFGTPGQAVWGVAEPAWVPPAGLNVPPIPSDDVMVLHVGGTSGAGIAMVRAPDPTIPAIYLANNCAKIQQDAYVMLSSCSMATVLRISNKPDTTAASCPANQSVAGGVEFDYAQTDSSGVTVNKFPNGSSSLVPPLHSPPTLASMASAQTFDEVTYYVGRLAGRPGPALYRYSLANAAAGPEEIIDHVDNMCVLYGVSAGAAIAYTPAAAVADWTKVVSVQVSLQSSGDDFGVVDLAQQPTLPWCGGTFKAADTKFHQVFTATAAMRDQLK